MKSTVKKKLAAFIAVTMMVQSGMVPVNNMVFADDGSTPVETTQEKTTTPASDQTPSNASESTNTVNTSEQKTETSESAAGSEQKMNNETTETKEVVKVAKSSYKVTVVYENILQSDGSYSSKTMNYTVSAKGSKKIASSTLNSYVTAKTVKKDGKTYVYASKWQGAEGQVSQIVIEGASLLDDTELRFSPVYDEYQDKKVTVNFNNIYKADGSTTSSTESTTLSKGGVTGWNFSSVKLQNKVLAKSFTFDGYKYEYSGKWINEDTNEEFSSLSVKYAELDGDKTINIRPVYNMTAIKKLDFRYIDNVSTGSGSWSNTNGDFTSYTHTFKEPAGQPHYKFINWEDSKTGATYVKGDKYSLKQSDFGEDEFLRTVEIYAIWQPSVTVNYHYNGKTISVEKYQDIDVYDQSLTIDGVSYDGWFDAEGNKLDANEVYQLPAVTKEKVERAEYDVYAKKAITVKANSNSWEYDGQEHSDSSFEIAGGSLFDGDVIVPTIEGSVKDVTDDEQLNVITDIRIMRGDKDVSSYYNISLEAGTLSVTPREVTITSATDSKKYDGKALKNDGITVSGTGFVEGEGASYDVTGSQTKVGSSANTFTYTLNSGTKAGNYSIETEEGTLTVEPAAAPVPSKNDPTPAPGPNGTNIADDPAPMAHSTTNIVDGKTPMAAPMYWALINLLCAIGAALLSLVMMIRYFGKKREEDEETGETIEIKRKGAARLEIGRAHV